MEEKARGRKDPSHRMSKAGRDSGTQGSCGWSWCKWSEENMSFSYVQIDFQIGTILAITYTEVLFY